MPGFRAWGRFVLVPLFIPVPVCGGQGLAYHLQALLQILQVAVEILQTNLVMQSLVTLPEVVGHLRVHVMDLSVAPLAQILHRLPVGIPDSLQLIRQRMMRMQQLKLPQHREIGEMRLHLACIEIVQIIQHRAQLVQQ